MRFYKSANYLYVLFFMLVLQGCVATQSFPTVARGGDTITLVVGSPDGMKKSNTTAQFTSDVDGSIASLPIRSIIRLRPDQTSELALFDSLVNIEDNITGHSQWLTVVVIDLPTGLTVGSGIINVASTASYGTFTYGINDIPISIDIIDGIGVRNDFTYNTGFGSGGNGDLSIFEALPQAVLRAPKDGTVIAAAEIKVKAPLVSVPDRAIRIVADDFYTKNPKHQVQMSWFRNGDQFTVNFISPKGKMKTRQLRFSIVLSPGNSFALNPAPSVTSVKLFDINGLPITISSGTPDKDLFTIGIE